MRYRVYLLIDDEPVTIAEDLPFDDAESMVFDWWFNATFSGEGVPVNFCEGEMEWEVMGWAVSVSSRPLMLSSEASRSAPPAWCDPWNRHSLRRARK